MISSKLKEIAKENDWNLSKKSVFGLYGDYYFQIENGWGYKRIISYIPEIDYDKKAEIKNSLLREKDNLNSSNVYIADNILAITFKEKIIPVKKQILINGLQYMSEVLKSNSIMPVNKCFQCSNSGEMKFYYNPFNGVTKMICQSCASVNESISLEKMRTVLYEGRSYLKGVAGAVLFSLIGIAGWVAFAVFLNIITSLGALLIGMSAFEGYRSFKGKIEKKAIWVLSAVIVFSIILANYLMAAWEIHSYNSGITPWEIIYHLFSNDIIRGSILKNILLSLLVSIFPFIYIIQYLNKNMNLPEWVEASKARA